MIHLPRLLFATDGSDCAERARVHAFDLAHRFDADLHVVHVEERDVELSDVIEIREADVLADLHLPLPDDAPVPVSRVHEHTVVHRSAADGLLNYAAEHDTPLIVLGTHGRRGVQRLVLGSVAEEVVRRAPGPVLTVGRGAPASPPTDGPLLVPVDFSDHQERLLTHARLLAQAYEVSIALLHVVNRADPPAAYETEQERPAPDVLRDRSTQALTEPAASLRDDGLDVQVEVRHGHPADEILTAADDLDAALLAIATHGRSGVERMLMGSVAETVIRRAPCPVFTVKSFGRSLVEEK
jgi:nucleotide-binding universal stress UspA family protein